LAQVVLNPASAQGAGRGRLNGHGLPGKWLVGQARDPVDRIFKPARQREIVFGRAEDDTVGRPDRIRKDAHRRRESGRILDVGIIERKFSEGWTFLDAHAGRCEPRQQVHDHAIVGAFAQAPADADDVGHAVFLVLEADVLIPRTGQPCKETTWSCRGGTAAFFATGGWRVSRSMAQSWDYMRSLAMGALAPEEVLATGASPVSAPAGASNCVGSAFTHLKAATLAACSRI